MVEKRKIELMQKTLANACKSVSKSKKVFLKAGAVLSNSDGEVLVECYAGELDDEEQCEKIILKKAENNNINIENSKLFITQEPYAVTIRDIEPIIKSGIKEVYIGGLALNPIVIGRGELFLRSKDVKVERYPHELVEKINKLNEEFIEMFKESILPDDSLFVNRSIPNLVKEYLNENKITVENIPLDWYNKFDYIAAFCLPFESKQNVREEMLNKALGYAYDKKYLNRDYKDDVRGNYNQWQSEFNNILKGELNVGSLTSLKTLVVGIGNGHEGKYLYSDIKDLTIVDIAPESLNRAVQILNPKRSYVQNAQNLSMIRSCSIDAYISLLTYQSTYFDIDRALTEAYRVLKQKGIIIISIACGFMKSDGVYIDGLIDPLTHVVDRNRPFELISEIRKILISFDFVSLGIRSTPSEIFIYGRKND